MSRIAVQQGQWSLIVVKTVRNEIYLIITKYGGSEKVETLLDQMAAALCHCQQPKWKLCCVPNSQQPSDWVSHCFLAI